jgi:hypothetical protein
VRVLYQWRRSRSSQTLSRSREHERGSAVSGNRHGVDGYAKGLAGLREDLGCYLAFGGPETIGSGMARVGFEGLVDLGLLS